MKLIEQWGEQRIQEPLKGSKRNQHVYKKVSGTLAKEGVSKSEEQCRTKLRSYSKIIRGLRTSIILLEGEEQFGSFMTC